MQNQQTLALARARLMNSSNGNGDGANSNMVARRTSATSVASAGGDSILESFTFVPPTPIAGRPSRSPLSQQVLMSQQQQRQQHQQQHQQEISGNSPPTTSSTTPSTTLASLSSSNSSLSELEPPRPSFRHQQGLSTSSQVSTGSALEGYTFHIDAGVDSESSKSIRDSEIVPVGVGSGAGAGSGGASAKRMQRQRASLDTLALTADLSAFTLNFDEGRDSFAQLRR